MPLSQFQTNTLTTQHLNPLIKDLENTLASNELTAETIKKDADNLVKLLKLIPQIDPSSYPIKLQYKDLGINENEEDHELKTNIAAILGAENEGVYNILYQLRHKYYLNKKHTFLYNGYEVSTFISNVISEKNLRGSLAEDLPDIKELQEGINNYLQEIIKNKTTPINETNEKLQY